MSILYNICCYCAVLSHVQLFSTPWTVAHQAPLSVHGVSQARVLEWVAISSSRGSFQLRDQTHISFVSFIDRFFTTVPAGKHMYICNLRI